MEVTFDTENNSLTIRFADGTVDVFHSRAELVSKHPELERYAAGMGW